MREALEAAHRAPVIVSSATPRRVGGASLSAPSSAVIADASSPRLFRPRSATVRGPPAYDSSGIAGADGGIHCGGQERTKKVEPRKAQAAAPLAATLLDDDAARRVSGAAKKALSEAPLAPHPPTPATAEPRPRPRATRGVGATTSAGRPPSHRPSGMAVPQTTAERPDAVAAAIAEGVARSLGASYLACRGRILALERQLREHGESLDFVFSGGGVVGGGGGAPVSIMPPPAERLMCLRWISSPAGDGWAFYDPEYGGATLATQRAPLEEFLQMAEGRFVGFADLVRVVNANTTLWSRPQLKGR